MARVKTLYVRDEDAPIWEEAAKAAAAEGASLSEFVTAAVRTSLENRPPAMNFKSLSVDSLVAVAHGTVVRRQTYFQGRWLVRHTQSADPAASPADRWSIAVTPGGAFVAYVLRGGDVPELGTNLDLNELQRNLRIPADVIATSLTVLDTEGWVVRQDF